MVDVVVTVLLCLCIYCVTMLRITMLSAMQIKIILINDCYELKTLHSRVFVLLACAVSAMLCEVVGSGVGSRVRRGHGDQEEQEEKEEVKGELDFDVVLCQSELTDRALQLCLLLPPGFQPVS